MEFILPIFYASIFILLIWKIKFFQSAGLSKKIISAIFLLKIFFGIVLWAIYTYHYTYRNTSDAYRFFDDATIIFKATDGNFGHFLQILFGINQDAEYLKPYLNQTSHWYRPNDYGLLNDDRTMIRFNAILLFFSFGNYHVHTVIINFLSLIGLISLFKTFYSFLPQRKTELFFSVFLIPTVLFWGSGVLKEGLILFSLGIFVFSFCRFLDFVYPSSKNLSGNNDRGSQFLFGSGEGKFSYHNFFIMIFSFLLLTIVKTYVLFCFIPAIISFVILKISGSEKAAVKFGITHFLFILGILNIQLIFPGYNLLETLAQKQRDFYNVAELWNAGSLIQIGHLEPNPLSFFKHIPQALSSVFLRPHLLEADSVFLVAASIENLIILGLIIFYLFHFSQTGRKNTPWILFCFSFVIFMTLLIGWTTPIMGAIVRYKLPFLPFLLFILILISKKPAIVIRIENLFGKKLP